MKPRKQKKAPKIMAARSHDADDCARAIQIECDEQVALLISALRVIIKEQGGQWFAQGVEIDYGAAGTSLEDVKDRFANGLALTAIANFQKFGNLDRMLKLAPEELWKDDIRQPHHSISFLAIAEIQGQADDEVKVPHLPWDRLAFLEPQAV